MTYLMPTLFIICGLPGAGKTTLAKSLEIKRSALRLCPDEWISEIIENPADKPELDRLRNPVEKLQWAVGERALSLGLDVILENGFWSREERDKIYDEGKALGANVELHFLDISIDELAKRLENRNQKLPSDTFKVTREELELWATWFESPTAEELAQYENNTEEH